MILYSKTYLKMHLIAQNGVNALRLCMRTLHKWYTDFMQLLIQDETISGLCLSTYALTNLYSYEISRVCGTFDVCVKFI